MNVGNLTAANECTHKFRTRMKLFLAGLGDCKSQQVVGDQLRDDVAIWYRQLENSAVTWLAYSLRLLEPFDSDELRRSHLFSFYTDVQRSEAAIEFVSAKYRPCKLIDGANESDLSLHRDRSLPTRRCRG